MGSPFWGFTDLLATDQHATMELLFHGRITTVDLARLRREPDLVDRVIKALHTHPENHPYFESAKEIMARNFFGPEEWYNFDRRITEDEMREIDSVFLPWTQRFLESPCPFFPLKRIKETHFASLEIFTFKGEWLDSVCWQNIFSDIFSETDALNFAKFFEPRPMGRPKVRWTLTLKYPVPDSENKTLAEQMEMLPPGYEITPVSTQLMNLFLCLQKDRNFPSSFNKIVRCGEEVSIKASSSPLFKKNPIFKDPEPFHPAIGWKENDGWERRKERKNMIRTAVVPDEEKSGEIALSASCKSPIVFYR